jgi:hypothetical protein
VVHDIAQHHQDNQTIDASGVVSGLQKDVANAVVCTNKLQSAILRYWSCLERINWNLGMSTFKSSANPYVSSPARRPAWLPHPAPRPGAEGRPLASQVERQTYLNAPGRQDCVEPSSPTHDNLCRAGRAGNCQGCPVQMLSLVAAWCFAVGKVHTYWASSS